MNKTAFVTGFEKSASLHKKPEAKPEHKGKTGLAKAFALFSAPLKKTAKVKMRRSNADKAFTRGALMGSTAGVGAAHLAAYAGRKMRENRKR